MCIAQIPAPTTVNIQASPAAARLKQMALVCQWVGTPPTTTFTTRVLNLIRFNFTNLSPYFGHFDLEVFSGLFHRPDSHLIYSPRISVNTGLDIINIFKFKCVSPVASGQSPLPRIKDEYGQARYPPLYFAKRAKWTLHSSWKCMSQELYTAFSLGQLFLLFGCACCALKQIH